MAGMQLQSLFSKQTLPSKFTCSWLYSELEQPGNKRVQLPGNAGLLGSWSLNDEAVPREE